MAFVEDAYRVAADRIAVLLALVGVLADRAVGISARGEPGHALQRDQLSSLQDGSRNSSLREEPSESGIDL
jgi:hypothetical protein